MGLKDKGTLLHKTSCTACGSSDANQVYGHEDGTTDTYCFACQAYDFKDRTTKRLSNKAEDDKVSMKDIEGLPSLGIRGVKDAVASLFGVKVGFSPNDGKTITKQFYPATRGGQVVGYEERNVLSKGFISIGDRTGDIELFGTTLAKRNGYKNLFITEGCLDAMSLYQVIIENTPAKFKEFKPSVVSLTRGVASGLKDLINNREFIDKYDNVTLVLDNDSAGLKAQQEILKTFHNFKVAELPLKDANAMLEAGKGKELYTACMWNAKQIRQGEVLDIHDFIEKALMKPEMGISFPWATVTKACFGIRPNTIHIVGAAPKIGKTDHQHQLVEHLIYSEKVKVGMFDLENAPAKTAKKLAGKHDKLDYSRPDVEYSMDALRATLESMEGVIRFYDRSASRDWEDIRVAIEEMHLLDGINIFILDPLTALISRYASSEANDKLNEIMTDMSDLVMKYPITIFCYSHVNPKPKGAKSHEQGGKVYSNEFTGSRAMEKWSHYGHGISRDRSEDCPPERKNMSEFRMLFDRDYGQSYCCDVYFDEATITYLEPETRYGR
jgi:twinkle protein